MIRSGVLPECHLANDPGDRQYPESGLTQGTGTQRNTEELTGTGNFFASLCTGNAQGFVREGMTVEATRR